jgi:hypothetical protein
VRAAEHRPRDRNGSSWSIRTKSRSMRRPGSASGGYYAVCASPAYGSNGNGRCFRMRRSRSKGVCRTSGRQRCGKWRRSQERTTTPRYNHYRDSSLQVPAGTRTTTNREASTRSQPRASTGPLRRTGVASQAQDQPRI